MKRIFILGLAGMAAIAHAEMDGAKILMEEAERAKEVQRLEYQAELLKQRAEIARYAEEIQKYGGDVSDLGIEAPRTSKPGQPVSSPALAPAASKPADSLPRVLYIENNRAAFATAEGKVFGKVGQTLPGGYQVVAISMRDGVRLHKNGMRYDIDIAW